MSCYCDCNVQKKSFLNASGIYISDFLHCLRLYIQIPSQFPTCSFFLYNNSPAIPYKVLRDAVKPVPSFQNHPFSDHTFQGHHLWQWSPVRSPGRLKTVYCVPVSSTINAGKQHIYRFSVVRAAQNSRTWPFRINDDCFLKYIPRVVRSTVIIDNQSLNHTVMDPVYRFNGFSVVCCQALQ